MPEANATPTTPRGEDPDASVKRLAEAAFQADARREAISDAADDSEAGDRAMRDASDAFYAAVQALTAAPARTLEGMAAKAVALRMLLHSDVPVLIDQTFAEIAEPHDLLAMSLARDLIARARGLPDHRAEGDSAPEIGQ